MFGYSFSLYGLCLFLLLLARKWSNLIGRFTSKVFYFLQIVFIYVSIEIDQLIGAELDVFLFFDDGAKFIYLLAR